MSVVTHPHDPGKQTRAGNRHSADFAKMLTVLRREYLSRVKTKGFIIGTILMPLLIIAMTVLPALFAMQSLAETKTIAVLDQTGEIFDALEARLDAKNEAGQRLYQLTRVPPDNHLETLRKLLAARVEAGELDYYMVVPADVFSSNRAEIYGSVVSNLHENREIEQAITRAVADWRLARKGLHPDSVRTLLAKVNLTTYKLSGGAEQEEQGFTIALAWVMVFFLYIAMILYGTIIMRSVLEEKTSRVVESVISSVRPFHLMAGKILGVGAVGLTQFLIWAVVAGAVSWYGSTMVGAMAAGGMAGIKIPAIPLFVLGYFILFFVLGYFLYATLYAGVGALVNSDQEAQQLAMPLVMFLVVPIMILWLIINNPDSQAAVILSLIPFFAPMVMFVRIVVQTPPAPQIAAAIVLLVITLVGSVWVVGKIFRVGVLMYGKRPTLPEIIKWIRHA